MGKQPETFIIYGANSAIGSELAKSLLPEVKELILFYHEKTDRIAKILTSDKVVAFNSDIKDYDVLLEQFSQIKHNNHIGAVYLPAVRSYDHKSLAETSLYLTREIIDVNLLGAIHFLKGLISISTPRTKETIDDLSMRIVLLGSNVSRTGLVNGSIYAATKAAIANLTRTVAKEEGKNHILINTISPGPVQTDSQVFLADYREFRKDYFETQKSLTSLNKLADVSDVCLMIKYLTSLENKHITGEEIFLTGGAL